MGNESVRVADQEPANSLNSKEILKRKQKIEHGNVTTQFIVAFSQRIAKFPSVVESQKQVELTCRLASPFCRRIQVTAYLKPPLRSLSAAAVLSDTSAAQFCASAVLYVLLSNSSASTCCVRASAWSFYVPPTSEEKG